MIVAHSLFCSSFIVCRQARSCDTWCVRVGGHAPEGETREGGRAGPPPCSRVARVARAVKRLERLAVGFRVLMLESHYLVHVDHILYIDAENTVYTFFILFVMHVSFFLRIAHMYNRPCIVVGFVY